MKATFFLLIPYTLIGTTIGELIEIKTPTETRYSNTSDAMDKAIIQNDIHRANYTPVSARNPSNMTIVPWPMSRILQNENLQSPNSEDSTSSPNLVSSPAPRMPKGMKISTNHSSGVTTGRQMIPVGQTGYLSWNEMSMKPNQTVSWGMKKFNSGKVHDSGTNNDVGETYFRRRNERRRKDEIISQYDENNQYDDYTAPDKDSSASNYEAENIHPYPANHGSSSGQYGSGKYDSYPMKNVGDYRNEQTNADYSRSPNPWSSSHRPRPINPEGYSRFTVEPSNDYRSHGEAPASLISIFYAIGSNLLQLFKIGLGSGLSLAIPIIALKIFVIPLKILTFIKIVKIIFKLVFIVPFFLRVFGPSISSAIGYHGTEFTNKMVGLPTEESRKMIDQAGENYTWLNNLTDVLPEALTPKHCPSRVACELGSYLASKSNIPKKINNYLATNDLEGNEELHEGRNENDQEVTTVFVKALTQRWAYNQCDVFVCGISI